ncbi:MAG: DNRLRE domain-containing protein [Bacteroidales bacterium]|jgi:hypothetical protein|nr:DNRLRE domain-containing protein [Bacteroidales bacterium]
MKKLSVFLRFCIIAIIVISFSLPAFAQKQKQVKQHNPYGKILTEQEKQTKRDSIVNYSDYIVRGKTTTMYFFRDMNNDVYEIHGLNVFEVLRGPKEWTGKNIYTIHKSRQVKYVPEMPINERFQVANYITPMYSEEISNGFFFLKKNSLNIEPYLKDTSFLYKHLTIYGRDDNMPIDMGTSTYYKINEPDRILCEYTSNLVEGIRPNEYPNNFTYTGLYQKEFGDIYGIYRFLLPYGNIYVEPKIQELLDKEKQTNHLLIDSTNAKKKVTPEEKEEFDLWLRGGRPNIPHRSRLKSTDNPVVNCEFYADYQHIVKDGSTWYYEFDLSIRYNSNDVSVVYPDNILLYFAYNPLAFGNNIVDQGKMTCIANNTVFDSSDYALQWRDHISNNDQALINLSPVYTMQGSEITYNRTAIPVGEKVNICKVRIEFPDSVLNSSNQEKRKVRIRELWDQLDWNFNHWSDAQNCFDCWYIMNETTFLLNNSYTLGEINITNVTAADGGSITGGTGCRVAIQGSGFLNNDILADFEETPAIFMPCPDTANAAGVHPYIPIDKNDIELWSDTLILFIMPSIAYGVAENTKLRNKGIGSGKLKVHNQVGREKPYAHETSVEYSILNTYSSTDELNQVLLDKKQVYWVRRNCNEQILFTAHNALTTKHIGLMEEAFATWNAALGFQFFAFKRDANGNVARSSIESVNDTINSIYYVYDGTSNALGAVTSLAPMYLQICNDNKVFTQIDFYLNRYKLDYATTPLSNAEIKRVIMHELGHGLGLWHCINKDDLMYFTLSSANTITESARNGALYIFESSKAQTWSPTCTNVEVFGSSTTSCSPQTPAYIKATGASKTEIQVEWLPNPLATSYTIQWSSASNMSNPQTITINDKNQHSYTHTGLTQNTNYYYRIRSNRAGSSSAYSYIANGKTKLISFSNTLKTISVENTGSEGIEIQWNDTDTTTSNKQYILERKEESSGGLKSGGDYEIIAVLEAAERNYFDYAVEDGKIYTYRIKTVTSTGVSEYSSRAEGSLGEYNQHSVVMPIQRSALLYNNTLPAQTNTVNTNYANYPTLEAWRWTHSGYQTFKRTVFDFDLSSIPSDAIITEAVLELKGADHMNNVTENNSTTYKSNASWLELITEEWDENQVTWNTQPASSPVYRVALANANSAYENYNVDISSLIDRMIKDSANTHGLMFKLQNEIIYARMFFGASTHATDSLHPVLRLKYVTVPEQTVQINLQNNAIVAQSAHPNSAGNEHSYYGDNELIYAERWTNQGYVTTVRGLMNFDLEHIPSTATITSARLNLYSTSQHFSTLSTGNSGYKSNACYLKRITTPWNANAVTWNSQPTTTTSNQVTFAQSTASSQDYCNINVDNLVQDMLNNPNSSFGVMLRLQNEVHYARMTFASAKHHNTALHPNLTVKYKVYPASLKSYIEPTIAKDYNSTRDMQVKTEREFIDSLMRTELIIAPNPTKDLSTISCNSINDEIQNIRIYNSSAQLIDQITVPENNSTTIKVDFTKYSKGIYIVIVQTRKGKTLSERIVYN